MIEESDVRAFGPKLLMPSGKVVYLDYGVEALLDFGDFVVVSLDVPQDMNNPYFENVFAFNKDGTLRWRIKPVINIDGDPMGVYYNDCFRKDNFAVAHALVGADVYLNPLTGEVVK